MEEIVFLFIICFVATILQMACVPIAQNKNDKFSFILFSIIWGICMIICLKELILMI